MSRISTSLVPPGGWRFEQDGILFQEQTFGALVEVITKHRASNGKFEGNPHQEIQDQICQRKPDSCLDVRVRVQQAPTTFMENLRTFAVTVKNFLMNGGAFVDQNTANIRAEVCARCHNNVTPGEARNNPAGCKKCGGFVNAAVASVRNLALGNRKTTSDTILKACFLCGCDLRLKVWLPVKYFDHNCENVNKYPTFCWMKDCKK